MGRLTTAPQNKKMTMTILEEQFYKAVPRELRQISEQLSLLTEKFQSNTKEESTISKVGMEVFVLLYSTQENKETKIDVIGVFSNKKEASRILIERSLDITINAHEMLIKEDENTSVITFINDKTKMLQLKKVTII